MPVPVRDNGEPGPAKRLLIFVHGFCSGHETWYPLLRILRHDRQVANRFDFETVDYATGPLAIPVLNRLPTVEEIGQYLDTRVRELMYDHTTGHNRYIDVTLVGHSMGGLAIQELLTKMLEGGRGSEFDYIRQAIFFATPHLGSLTMEGLRGFLGKFLKNVQDEMLRGLNAKVAELHQKMEMRVLRASRRGQHKYPLPITVFWGLEDNIVPEISARGFFPVAMPLPGNHLQIHCPATEHDDVYKAFVEAVEHPYGHSAIYEIDMFRYSARVVPLPSETVRTVNLLNKTKQIATDNEAFVTREVTFSMNNSCTDDFELKYRTNDAGYIEPLMIPKINMRPDHRSAYDSSGTAVNYGAPAIAGQKYALNMKVLNGFSIGNRDFHQHFTNKCYYRRVRFELDLTAYIAAGWHVSDVPKLYYHATDSEDHELCKSRDWCRPYPATGHQAEGKWMWELEYITNGVLDLKWDVSE